MTRVRTVRAAGMLGLLAWLAGAGSAAGQGLEWARTFQRPGVELGTGVAVSPDGGSVYVVGSRYSSFWDEQGGGEIRKLNPDGSPVWAKQLTFDAGGVAVDSGGAVYVTGTRWEAGGGSVAVLRKMGEDGSVAWQRDLPAAGGNGASQGLDLAIGPGGAIVWVAGGERTAAGWDLRLAKYTSDGGHLWSRTHRAPTGNECLAAGVALDREGNGYVAGHAATMSGDQILESRPLVGKFSRGGALLWMRYLPVLAEHYDYAYDVAVSADGALYVAADRYSAATGFDGLLWKLSAASGGVLWKRTVATADDDNLLGVAVDKPSGEVWAAGGLAYFSDATAALLSRHAATGARLREERYLSPAAGLAAGRALAVAGDGAVYVTGYMTSAGASQVDLWLAKYR